MKCRLHKVFFSIAACCLSLHDAAAHDDLYFSPKRQRELDRQQAERRAAEITAFGLKRGYAQEPQPQEERYTESWGDVDSLGSRPNSKIYEINRDYEASQDERDEDSYAARLRYDDPTYIVYARNPYWYDPWWSYPSIGFYGTWGDRWGWGLGWNSPYYGYGWGYPYYHSYYSPYYWGYYPSYFWGGYHPSSYANVTHQQRTSNMSGTNRGTGYTSGRIGSGQRYSSGGGLAVPNSSTNYRGIRGSGGSGANAAQPSVQASQQKQGTTSYRGILGRESSTSTSVEQRSSSTGTRSYGSSSSSNNNSSGNYGSSSRSGSGSSSYGTSSSRSSGGSSSRGSSSGRR
ncbi:MAG: hypothetical protein LBL94_07285 [Prevotellaceae bacterium]|jgi:hypothetical protein|nr:hypothetical protein [Prevotellaceae bacterium]